MGLPLKSLIWHTGTHTNPIPPMSYRGCLKMTKLLPKSYPNWPWPPLKPKNFDFFVDDYLVTIKIFDMAYGHPLQMLQDPQVSIYLIVSQTTSMAHHYPQN